MRSLTVIRLILLRVFVTCRWGAKTQSAAYLNTMDGALSNAQTRLSGLLA